MILRARYRNSGHCPWKSMIGINRRVKRLRERTFKQWFIDSVRVGMPIEMGTDMGKKPRHPGRGHRGAQPALPCNWSFCTKGRQANVKFRASKCLWERRYLLLNYLIGLIQPYGEICPHYNHFHHHEPLPHEWALPCQESDTLHFSELRDLDAFPISYTHIYTHPSYTQPLSKQILPSYCTAIFIVGHDSITQIERVSRQPFQKARKCSAFGHIFPSACWA